MTNGAVYEKNVPKGGSGIAIDSAGAAAIILASDLVFRQKVKYNYTTKF